MNASLNYLQFVFDKNTKPDPSTKQSARVKESPATTPKLKEKYQRLRSPKIFHKPVMPVKKEKSKSRDQQRITVNPSPDLMM